MAPRIAETLGAMTPLPLVFSAPRRGKPPRHLADLSAEQRAEAVAALGEKPFRAKQLSRHYFARLSVDAPSMTDIPQPARAALVTELLPPLLTEVRAVSCDNGATSKSLWRAHDGTLVESVVMRYDDRATVCVSSQAALAGGATCPPRRSPSRSGRRRRRSGTAALGRPGGCPTWCSWAWASRWPTTGGRWMRYTGSATRSPADSGSRSVRSPFPRLDLCMHYAGWRVKVLP